MIKVKTDVTEAKSITDVFVVNSSTSKARVTDIYQVASGGALSLLYRCNHDCDIPYDVLGEYADYTYVTYCNYTSADSCVNVGISTETYGLVIGNYAVYLNESLYDSGTASGETLSISAPSSSDASVSIVASESSSSGYDVDYTINIWEA